MARRSSNSSSASAFDDIPGLDGTSDNFPARIRRFSATHDGSTVDTQRAYPNFIRLLDALGVASQVTGMSFSVGNDLSGLECVVPCARSRIEIADLSLMRDLHSLADRWRNEDMCVNAMHPGWADLASRARCRHSTG